MLDRERGGRGILDSRGNPTVEAEVAWDRGTVEGTSEIRGPCNVSALTRRSL